MGLWIMPVNVELIHTEGYGLEAEVVFGDTKLTVMDAFSVPDKMHAPGLLEDVGFCANEFSGPSWEEIFQGNPTKEKKLERLSGWSYFGYGEIVSINPTSVDFGIFTLEAGPRTNDARCIGEFVKVHIDRSKRFGARS